MMAGSLLSERIRATPIKANKLLLQSKNSLQKPGGLFSKLSLFYKINVEEKILHRFAASTFYNVFGGHIMFQTMHAAVELGLFTLLDDNKSMTREEIQNALKIEEQPCKILLMGLVAGKILKKKSNHYSNTFISKKLLNENSADHVINYVKLQHCVMYPALFHMTDSVLQNTNVGIREFKGDEPTIYQRIAHTPEVEEIFQGSMQELSNQSNIYLADHLDLSRSRYLVDVGGGDGTNAMTIASRNPHMRAAVLDSKSVCEIARKNIAEKGLKDRVEAIEGNAFEGGYPKGVDTILFCHFFTIWSKKENLALLNKAYDSLGPGGRCMIFNMMQHDEETGPMSAAIGSPYFLSCATGKGMLYTWKEYEELFRQAGFTNISRKKLPRDHGVIIGSKP